MNSKASKNIAGTDVTVIAYMPKGRTGWEVELGRKIGGFYPGLHFGEFSGSGEEYITPSLKWTKEISSNFSMGLKGAYPIRGPEEGTESLFLFLQFSK